MSTVCAWPFWVSDPRRLLWAARCRHGHITRPCSTEAEALSLAAAIDTAIDNSQEASRSDLLMRMPSIVLEMEPYHDAYLRMWWLLKIGP